jgi:hypothetical protein
MININMGDTKYQHIMMNLFGRLPVIASTLFANFLAPKLF